MKKILFLVSMLFATFCAFGQETGTVRGEVFNEEGFLQGVEISIEGVSSRLLTDADGAFSIDLEPGTYAFSFRFPGHNEIITAVTPEKNKTKNIEIEMFADESISTEKVLKDEFDSSAKTALKFYSFIKSAVLRIN